MFRFSIRDLLWVTLVVALGLGWLVHQRQLRAEVNRGRDRATKWRQCAGALEFAFTHTDCEVTWDMKSMWVHVLTPNRGGIGVGISQFTQPSTDDD